MPPALTTYLIRFKAREEAPVDDAAAERLRAALQTLPGIGQVHGTTVDPERGVVSGEFQLDVSRGIGAASRDGARIAREALKNSEMADARLIELWAGLREERPE